MRHVKPRFENESRSLKNKVLLGLILLCLIAWLTACASPSAAIRDGRLTEDCQKPELRDKTNGGLFRLSLEQAAALAECSDRMRALR